MGITRVRPLAGGFEAWRAGGFPLEPVVGAASTLRLSDPKSPSGRLPAGVDQPG